MKEKEARQIVELVKLVYPVAWVEPLEPCYRIVVEVRPKDELGPSEEFMIPSLDAFLMFLKWARDRGKI